LKIGTHRFTSLKVTKNICNRYPNYWMANTKHRLSHLPPGLKNVHPYPCPVDGPAKSDKPAKGWLKPQQKIMGCLPSTGAGFRWPIVCGVFFLKISDPHLCQGTITLSFSPNEKRVQKGATGRCPATLGAEQSSSGHSFGKNQGQ
jgi:hypothetical protein